MKKAYELYQNELSAIREAGTYKDERIIVTPSAPASTPPWPRAW